MRTVVLLAAFGWNAAAPAQTTWGKTDHKGEPWVKNSSRPFSIENGLEGRHLSVWASHGRYFDQTKDTWKWQRPSLFCTNEDLYTQTIVVPYLIPMLENAGAVVFTPRERDWQRHEVVVDNDDRRSLVFYRENSLLHPWATAPAPGFAFHEGPYHDQENPFAAGSARMAATTRSKSKLSTVNYQPDIPEEGRYAVYVSYQTVEGSIDDAAYTVWHKGQ
ncbi:MAG: xanthan lyase, partial [Prevotella sp.]|nr:xanthan lyase [Prevotella sp.]